jgi:hypothetical protein
MLEKSSQYKCTILHDKYNGTNVVQVQHLYIHCPTYIVCLSDLSFIFVVHFHTLYA